MPGRALHRSTRWVVHQFLERSGDCAIDDGVLGASLARSPRSISEESCSSIALFRIAQCAPAELGTVRSGIGDAWNSRRQGFAIHRAAVVARLILALSVAIPVFAYIWR